MEDIHDPASGPAASQGRSHCETCKKTLTGRQERYCSTACRVRAWHLSKAEERLAGLPQAEFRAVLRRVAEKRWPGLRGRIRVRFGRPGMAPGGPGPRS